MKLTRSLLGRQRHMLDAKLTSFPQDRAAPRLGWLKAVREALGLSALQLGQRMGVTQPVIFRMEQREKRGAVTLEALDRAARAMQCRLIYAIVPEEAPSLEGIVSQRALRLARALTAGVERSMALEDQEVPAEFTKAHVQELADELKRTMDPRLWSEP
jgi:predicted DNA-binding mobile mystery protein A